jgi:integrase
MSSQRSSRRANVRRRGSTYTYYVHVPDGRGGYRQISHGGFKTQREAEVARAEAIHAIATGTYVRPERLTLGEFLLDEWLPSKAPPVLEESTYVSYRQKIDNHVVPRLGAIPLQQLSPVDLNRLYRELLTNGRQPTHVPTRRYPDSLYDRVLELRFEGHSYRSTAAMLRDEYPEHAEAITRDVVASICRRASETAAAPAPAPSKGLSPRSVRYVHSVLHAALKDALRWNRIVRNPADAATPPPESSTKAARPGTWTADQLRCFLDFTEGSRYLPAWLFIATSGCRRGECLGLTWDAVDLEQAVATLSRQVTVVNGSMRVKELPKTKRGHMISLDSTTVAILRSWKAAQNEERLLAGTGYHADGFVFCQADGTPYHPERFSREFQRKQDQHNRARPDAPLPRLGLHGLRHTWATLALQAGIDIKIVSERLNHSSSHITREIYTHVTPPMRSDAADKVAEQIFGPRSTREARSRDHRHRPEPPSPHQ